MPDESTPQKYAIACKTAGLPGGNVNAIGSLNETDLHAEVKEWYAAPDDQLEVAVDGFVIDLLRADGELVEIQTANFGALRAKLNALLPAHRVRVVYPVAQQKWIVKISEEGEIISRRKSPKAGRVEAIFGQLVYLPQALGHPNFCLDVLMVQAEELWRAHAKGGKRGWRRQGWIVHGRRLLDVLACHTFTQPSQLAQLLPDNLPPPYTTGELAKASGLPPRLAGQMAYCLREMGQIQVTGKRGNALLYTQSI
ncbi:MAG: hypothetical protein WBO46_11130 [Caldilineaceae bacterium]